MSKKFTIATILLLTFGGIMIPGGFVVNNVIRDLTYGSVDEGLLGIKEQGIPLVKESVEEMGLKSVAISLGLVKEMGADSAALLANTTVFIGQILNVEMRSFYNPLLGYKIFSPMQTLYFDMVNISDPDIVITANFSVAANSGGYPPIKGVSEWYGADLNFTRSVETLDFTGLDNLKYGVNTSEMWWGDRLPGIYEDTYRRVGDTVWPPDNPLYNFSASLELVDMNQDRGWGVIEIMDLIENANETEMELMCGEDGYNFTNPDDKFLYKGENYTKLEILYFYLVDYYFPEAISLIIDDFNHYGTNLFKEYPIYQPRDWNYYDTDYRDITVYSIVEQWAKCISYDEGADFHESEASIPAGTFGLEPAGPGVSSGIPMQAALQLWNASNEFSFTNINGIYKWFEANSSGTVFQELLDEFSQYPGYENSFNPYWNENDTYGEADWGFNETDMNLILDWLWGNGGGWNHGSFYEKVFPELITDPACFRILLEQWAYGSIVGNVLYPDGFPLPLGSVTVMGFEIGYQGPGQPVIPTNMSIKTALKLWDETNAYSLVSGEGLQKWFAAVGGDTEAKAMLMAANGLSEGDTNLLLEWIPNFQHNVMPYLAQYQYSLPLDSITLGNIVQVGGIGIGAACVGIGALGIVGKTVTKKKRLNPFELGS